MVNSEGGYYGNMNALTEGLAGLAPRRRAAGYTQESLAGALGITRSLLAAWETGRAWPSARWLPVIAARLGCGVGELYSPPADADNLSQEEDDAGRMQESVL